MLCPLGRLAARDWSSCLFKVLALNSATARELGWVGGNSVRYEGNSGTLGRTGDLDLVSAIAGAVLSRAGGVGGSSVIRSALFCGLRPESPFKLRFG